MLNLAFDLQFHDLYRLSGLTQVDQAFLAMLAESDVGLWARLADARKDPERLERKAESELLLAL